MENKFNYHRHRNSYTELNEAYFWTITCKNWIPLLANDDYKRIIVDSLKWLYEKELVKIYGFVIMPNHIHLIWNQLKMNGKEFPKNSFEKFTAHSFRKKLLIENEHMLQQFEVSASDRSYNFWQRDPLAIRIFNREMLLQKLDYLHYNPKQEHWQLSKTDLDYYYSSAQFYETGIDNFGFLTHAGELF
jgi:putative transposase